VLSVNDHLFCLLVTIDAALQAGAARVTVVLPTYPYSRQHKKLSRESLSAARVGQIFENLGVSRLVTLDIHSKEIENSFNHMRLENLHGAYQIVKQLATVADLKDEDLVIVSPERRRGRAQQVLRVDPRPAARDALQGARLLARGAERGARNITGMHLLGAVAGKTVLICDDMLGTGGTMIKAMRVLKDLGAARILAAASLPLFTARAVDSFDAAYREGLFHRIIGTNAVYLGDEVLGREWYLSADVSNLFARIIWRLHHNRSLGSLLDDRSVIKDLLKRS